MNNKNILIVISLVLALILFGSFFTLRSRSFSRFPDYSKLDKSESPKQGNALSNGKNSCIADECLNTEGLTYPVGDLTEDAKSSLFKALDDEYKAQATYEAIIKKLGSIRPFIMIIRAEEQHISSLKSLFDKYGLIVPENPYTNKVVSPETLLDACTAGVSAELSNVSLYEETLLPTVSAYEDITLVFTNLMNASKEKHLPAFQRCAN